MCDRARRRSATRDVANLLRAIVEEVFSRPAPEPVLYLRCDRCEQVAPHRSTVEAIVIRGDDRGMSAVATPPETACPLCRYAQPRVVGDEVVGTVSVRCGYRWGWQLGWRRCATVHAVPGGAVRIACPCCGTTTDGPAA